MRPREPYIKHCADLEDKKVQKEGPVCTGG